ncbi:hypothetical protein K523DRAFT_322130 [Schizophyllum commune Tattone D]|nr:hypothetical protein K523DRAFT_322130 [Schizophyllum commune Tattone D]
MKNLEDRNRLRSELYTGCHDYLGRIANDWDDGDGRAWPLCREQAPGPRTHRDLTLSVYDIQTKRGSSQLRGGRPHYAREAGGVREGSGRSRETARVLEQRR